MQADRAARHSPPHLSLFINLPSTYRHLNELACRLTELQLVCTALTRISEADEMAYQIRQCNGVTLLGKLLLVDPMASSGGCS